jgi:hypothetical protein
LDPLIYRPKGCMFPPWLASRNLTESFSSHVLLSLALPKVFLSVASFQ